MLLHVQTFGTGEPLLFLHSGGETGQSDFQQQKEFFTDFYQVIMPDLRGNGQPKRDDYDSIQELIQLATENLLETIQHYKWEKVNLVASSAGAFLAIQFAKTYPQFVKSLCISGVHPVKTEEWEKGEKVERKQREALLGNAGMDQFFQKVAPKFMTLSLEEDWYPFELTRDLSFAAHIPTLVMAGAKQLSELQGLIHYREKYPKVEVAAIPFAGHLPYEDEPQLFNEVLLRFLRR